MVNPAVGLPGDGGADHIGDGQGTEAFAARFAEGGKGVDGLPGLADDKDEGTFVQGRVPVAEFGSIFDFHWDTGETLDQIFGHQAGVPSRPAGTKGYGRLAGTRPQSS